MRPALTAAGFLSPRAADHPIFRTFETADETGIFSNTLKGIALLLLSAIASGV